MSHSTTNAIPTSRKGAAGYLCGIQQQYMAKKRPRGAASASLTPGHAKFRSRRNTLSASPEVLRMKEIPMHTPHKGAFKLL